LADGIEQQLSQWLRERFGPAVGIGVARADRLRPLFPEEEEYVRGAVEGRRIEFSVGRWCAREALAERGIAPQAIGVGMRMAPAWPEGFCGAITHCGTQAGTHSGGPCAAVAALTTDFAGLGIDIVDLEEARPILASADSFIAREAELTGARMALGESGEEAHAPVILFSAKESAIKAMTARFDRFVDFTEVEVRFDRDAFTARARSFGVEAEGWWAVRGGYVFTAAIRR